jgi:Spy/CpxP family protein refolding chaperone
MKARSALGGLALVLGMALPAAAEPPDGRQLAQSAPDASRPAPDPGARPQWGHRPEGSRHGHHGWHRHAKAHHFSLASLALRHQKDLALTPDQVTSLRKLGTDSQRDGIKRQAERRLAALDLRMLMMPDPSDPNKPRDLPKIEAKVREIAKLRADATIERIRNLEASRQVLTPEQRDKLRGLLAQRWQHHHGPEMRGQGMRGMAPEEDGQQPAAAPENGPREG